MSSGSNAEQLSLALLGSGEFEPWTEEVDRWLLGRATGDGSVLVLPTASAPEGDPIFDGWANLGLDHYAQLGIPAQVVPLKTREDADRSSFSKPLVNASMVFFSGGNPAYLAGVLRGSRFWSELLPAMRRGLAYAGCSAGIACLGEVAPDSAAHMRGVRDFWKPVLALFPGVHFGPHWDALDRFVPGLRAMIIASVPVDRKLVAVDEHTAMVGDGREWRVMGAGKASVRENGQWRTYSAGESFAEPLDVSIEPAPAQA